MKKYIEWYFKWLSIWLWILTIIWLWWVAYWAYVSMTNVTAWTPLSADSFNQVLTNIDYLKTTVDNIPAWPQWATWATWPQGIQWPAWVDATAPSWAVMAFYLSSCPTWWIVADWTNGTPDLRGEFIRWLDNGKWTDTWRTLWSFQRWSLVMNSRVDTDIRLFSLSHQNDDRLWYDYPVTDSTVPYYRVQIDTTPTYHTWTTNWLVDYQYVKMTRPRNVALLYCIKQ